MRSPVRSHTARRYPLLVQVLESRVNPVSFASPVGYFTPSNAMSIAEGDFNGDGIPDVVTGNISGVTTFINDGSGALTNPTTLALGTGFPRSIRVADMNNDGFQDIVTGNDNGHNVAILKGNGDGTFQAPVVVTAGNSDVQAIAVADLNGDGKLDVAAAVDGGLAVLPTTASNT